MISFENNCIETRQIALKITISHAKHEEKLSTKESQMTEKLNWWGKLIIEIPLYRQKMDEQMDSQY